MNDPIRDLEPFGGRRWSGGAWSRVGCWGPRCFWAGPRLLDLLTPSRVAGL